MEKGFERNLKLLNIIYILKWFVLMLPVTVLFFTENGLNGEEILKLTSYYAVSIVIFEIPSGYLADLWGRKNSIVSGLILSLIGTIFFLFPGYYYFLIAEIFLGVGASFISGCDSALFYDSLLSLKKESSFQKLISRYRSYGNFSEGFSGIAGGFIASYAVVYTVYGRILVLFIGVLISLLLVEPKVERIKTDRLKNLFIVIKYALYDNKKVKWLILLGAVLGAVTLNMAWFSQFFFKHINLDPFYYGVIWAIMQFASGIYAILGLKFVNLIGKRNSMISLIVFIIVGFFGLSFSTNIFIGIIFILTTYFIRGINLPVLDYYIHNEVSSDKRATTLSIKSLMVRLIYSLFAPLYGYLIDKYSLSLSLQSAGLIYSIIGTIAVIAIINVMDLRRENR
ncbi:MAG: hypothetical protein CR982_03635 [Candidatus Cloacimonadota bacterium]|nr:MAG: hypothetical protein CR982_03635 [Candidatus Cloacimonadota bacterium]PIE78881.1 MAG: hypothetical protein CSA15_05510 [Candidatus Delongbacteria bacterium]